MQQGKNPMPTPRGAFETRWKGPLFACSWLFYPWVEFGSSKKPLSKWKIKRDIVARDKKNKTSTDKTNKTCTKKTCTNKTKRASENNGRGLARERVIPCFSFRKDQGPVVRRPISANPGLNYNPDLSFFSSKAFSRTILSILFRVANHQIVDKKNWTEFAF